MKQMKFFYSKNAKFWWPQEHRKRRSLLKLVSNLLCWVVTNSLQLFQVIRIAVNIIHDLCCEKFTFLAKARQEIIKLVEIKLRKRFDVPCPWFNHYHELLSHDIATLKIDWNVSHKCCIHVLSLQYELVDVFPNYFSCWNVYHKLHTRNAIHCCEPFFMLFQILIKIELFSKSFALIWFFTRVDFLMSPQIISIFKGITTRLTFVQF